MIAPDPKASFPAIFAEAIREPWNSHLDRARAEGAQVIGYTCSYVPEPLISVAGLVPVRMRAPGTAATPMADTYLSSVICPYTRSLLELALESRQLDLGGWVFTSSCDHLRRLFDNLEYLLQPSFLHLLDLPHKSDSAAVAWFRDELAALADALAEHFGVDTGDAALRAAIAELNDNLALLRSIGEMRRNDAPPLTGAQMHTLLVASASAPRRVWTEALTALRDQLADAEGISEHRARLMVIGSQLDDPQYLEVIESQGGLVVADRFCLGSFPGLEPIAASHHRTALNALADHYLCKTKCPRMMDDFDQRVADVLETVASYRVDGVVIETMKFCDIWGVESSALADALRSAGLPVLRVEREYALSGEGQLRTRIQAFLESMGR